MIATIVNLVLFGLSVIPFVYCFTFLFKKHTAAWLTLTLVCVMGGAILLIAGFFLSSIIKDKLIYDIIERGFFRLFPPYNMAQGMFWLPLYASFEKMKELGDVPKEVDFDSPFHWNITGQGNLYMGSEFVVYTIILLLLETNVLCLLCKKKGQVCGYLTQM